mmetsp:Transcript_8239/g.12159  ORF Transcript_8239/g.12159 Transcript_8239/m.12159 type:complete len:251 (-) Transcript_8239:253-1005(-)|eukprot:CAMPEP_0197245270 /NCGR_PEP_ID=MMETSP1429-20130617/10105_1 /TAXON_ID=49237 /ORGANISM="Chaetoceros  sp., Strain UNC1202" /LENGTH=250 /DNA_ID=CAMNT_0042705733 /DNA_START=39 /DNA_END=791 /DNA_ORIENTATION=+
MKFVTRALAIASLCASQSSAFAPSSTAKHAIASSQQRFTSTLSMASNGSPLDFFSGLFPKQQGSAEAKPKIPNVVVDSDFTLSYVFAAIGIFIILTSPSASCVADGSGGICEPSVWGAVQGGLNLLFASFLAVQAKRIRFVFDETSFELKNVDVGASEEEVLTASGENFVVGGANRWDYDSFVNFDFFPSAKYPILVYFKETQTPTEKWSDGPGKLDKVGGGQIHFFPAIANVKQLAEQFELRGCSKKDA